MRNIKEQKLIYHLTCLDNVPAILDQGLLPRSQVTRFTDVADSEILSGRANLGLEHKVPFHFFAGNPFDGRVQKDHPDKEFVLFTVHRELAAGNNWEIIPFHPLASANIELLDYQEGINTIDWEAMNRRDYHDEHSKRVCMAECLSPQAIEPSRFYMVFVGSDETKQAVEKAAQESGLNLDVVVNSKMFVTQ